MQPYQQLEHAFAEWNDLDPSGMVVTSSGTSALHLAIEAMRLPLGSKIIVPDFAMIACPRACVLAGMEPVFVDCDERLLMPRQSSGIVMVVHIYGRRADVGGDVVIEDLAEAHGVRPHESTDAACWSFYKNKIVAGEEGGMVWFKSAEHAALARQLRSLGFTDAHDFMHVPRGHNYRLSNAHASLILESLANVDANVAKRREIEAKYDAICPDEWRMPPRDAPWTYDLRIPGMTSETQGRVVASLQAAGIPARHFFRPMHLQEEFCNCKRSGGDNAEMASREGFYLPILPNITTESHVKLSFDIIHRHLSSSERQ